MLRAIHVYKIRFDIYDTANDPEVTHTTSQSTSVLKTSRNLHGMCHSSVMKSVLNESKVKKNVNCNNKSQHVMNWALGREAWPERWKRKVR
jgi:hypothetical protein